MFNSNYLTSTKTEFYFNPNLEVSSMKTTAKPLPVIHIFLYILIYKTETNLNNSIKENLNQSLLFLSLIAATQLPSAGIATGNKLYSTRYNYMDFNVDEVGLWVIYSTYDSNNTLVAKVKKQQQQQQQHKATQLLKTLTKYPLKHGKSKTHIYVL